MFLIKKKKIIIIIIIIIIITIIISRVKVWIACFRLSDRGDSTKRKRGTEKTVRVG